MTLDATTSSQKNAVEDFDLDAESLNAIRSILTDEAAPEVEVDQAVVAAPAPKAAPRASQRVPRKADALPRLQSAEIDPQEAATPRKRGISLRRKPKVQARPASKPSPAAQSHAQAPKSSGMLSDWIQRIKAYRPKPAHIALAVLGVFVVMHPWLVLGLVLLSLIVLVGVFLIVGYDGFWKGVMKAGRWYAKRNPTRAAVINKRLDDFAMRWDAFLDKFPEGSVDGLYLPDFGDLAMADQRHEEAVDRRLASLSETRS